MAMMCFHSQPRDEYGETDDTGIYPAQPERLAFRLYTQPNRLSLNTTFFWPMPHSSQRGDQLWCPGKQQAKKAAQNWWRNPIQQCNTQSFFWPGLCLPTLLQNILPLPAKTGRFVPFCKTVFICQIINSLYAYWKEFRIKIQQTKLYQSVKLTEESIFLPVNTGWLLQ